MDLYFMPMTCSLAAYITCLEAGIRPTLHRVDRKTKTCDDGRDYRAIAPHGNVPALALGDDGVLTESSAVLEYLADRVPAAGLAPPPGTLDRYRVAQWLSFTASEIHKKLLWPIFNAGTPTGDAHKAWSREHAPATLGVVDAHLATRAYLVGEQFTIADVYLFWALLVAPAGGIPLDAFPNLTAYVARIRARPAVQAAIAHDYPLYASR